MSKVLLILSGGVDSTTLLYDLMKGEAGEEIRAMTARIDKPSFLGVHALSFNYGQRHSKELEYASRTCQKLKIEHSVIDLTSVFKYLTNSALTGDINVPRGTYDKETMSKTVVPNRNMIMLSVAIGFADNNKFDFVAIANHAGDHYVYPDCRPKFIENLNRAAILGTVRNIGIYAPYTEISKADIIRNGLKLGIDYDADTWSCYCGQDTPCGECGTCIEREKAMNEVKNG